MMNTLTVFSEKATGISCNLVDCKGCTICCEKGGLVNVLKQEVDTLRCLGVPLFEIDGINFIQRLQDGSCPMLDREGRGCSIYEHRPLCCRLYPLDVISIGRQLRWALATLCPENRKHFETWQGPDSQIGSGSIARIATNLGTVLVEKDIVFFKRKEDVLAAIELLDDDQNGWIPLSEI